MTKLMTADMAVVQDSAKVDYSVALASKCVMGLARRERMLLLGEKAVGRLTF